MRPPSRYKEDEFVFLQQYDGKVLTCEQVVVKILGWNKLMETKYNSLYF